MTYGRGEKEIGDALRRRGLEVIPQVRVPHDQSRGHYYDIDLALFPLAVEVHGDKIHPRYRPHFQDRSTWLIRQGWAIAYVWLYKEHRHTNEVIDELESFYRDLQKGNADRYRLYHWDGQLMERGGIEIEYYLSIDTAPWRKRAGEQDDFDRGRNLYNPTPQIPDELQPKVPKRRDIDLGAPPRSEGSRPLRPLRRPLRPVPGAPALDDIDSSVVDDEEDRNAPFKTDPAFDDPPER